MKLKRVVSYCTNLFWDPYSSAFKVAFSRDLLPWKNTFSMLHSAGLKIPSMLYQSRLFSLSLSLSLSLKLRVLNSRVLHTLYENVGGFCRKISDLWRLCEAPRCENLIKYQGQNKDDFLKGNLKVMQFYPVLYCLCVAHTNIKGKYLHDVFRQIFFLITYFWKNLVSIFL